MKKVNEGEFLHPCRSLLELNKKKQILTKEDWTEKQCCECYRYQEKRQ